ncbi:uncharacterized protein H6S33_005714 [Morchella sextelata]|uniref:uncharacterized protein n=1 Tax=Morchella sextelata TaxID=1174677 RepID=UPI001D03C438|nr:uncharacterized protein H6S33_005714 [Morchella sextelata]KAH0613828.1 hypothetical protein H6S33_005714 [Morchella sextelata]
MYTTFRQDSPLSYMSITPSATPELTGLSPAPRPRPHLQLTSNLSEKTSSNTTFWSAIAPDTHDNGCEFNPVMRSDSGILVSPTSEKGGRERRESVSSGSASTQRSGRSGRSASTAATSTATRRSSTRYQKYPPPPSRRQSSIYVTSPTTSEDHYRLPGVEAPPRAHVRPESVFGAPVVGLGAVTIDWKGDEARRREYEEADKEMKGWRRWLCGLGGRKRVFWEGEDNGSVRRYRLDLPPAPEAGVSEGKRAKSGRSRRT